MGKDWILDVLTDLRTFAVSNGMPALAEQLDDTRIVAMSEIASSTEGRDPDNGTDVTAERYFDRVGADRLA